MRDKIKINIVVGGTFHIAMLVEKLENLGYDVKIYTSTPKFKFKKESFYDQVVYIPMLFQMYRKISKRLISSNMKYFDKILFDKIVSLVMRRCDVLYGFAGASLFSGQKTLSQGGRYLLDRACPHIEFQNSLLKIESRILNVKYLELGRAMIKRCLEEYDSADRIIVPSNYSEKTFLERGFSGGKIKVAPLEAKILTPSEKNFKNFKKKEIIFCSVGGGLLRKGFLYLLRAWDNIQLKNSKLYLKTNKRELEQNEEMFQILQKNKNIIFHGYYEDINDFYNQCDVFCIPSIDDGFGMVVPEAMANSLPCIVTENVGASSLIRNSENGFVVPIQAEKEIETALEYFYNNRSEVKRMGQKAYKDYLLYIKNNNYQDSLNKALACTYDEDGVKS